MTTESYAADPYTGAPGIMAELCWVIAQALCSPFDEERDREFWLRKAAALDRLAIDVAAKRTRQGAAEEVELAEKAARRLVEYDATHTGLSLRGSDVVTGEDCRAYVRREYRDWNHAQHI